MLFLYLPKFGKMTPKQLEDITKVYKLRPTTITVSCHPDSLQRTIYRLAKDIASNKK